jgi:hypothetical protein
MRGWTVDRIVKLAVLMRGLWNQITVDAVESSIDGIYKQFHIHIDTF